MLPPQPRPDKTHFSMMSGLIQAVGLAPIVAFLWLPDRQRALNCA
jgi:hypothetical protein